MATKTITSGVAAPPAEDVPSSNCGDPSCSGECCFCREYRTYCKQSEQWHKECKKERYMEDAMSRFAPSECMDLVRCSCKNCVSEE